MRLRMRKLLNALLLLLFAVPAFAQDDASVTLGPKLALMATANAHSTTLDHTRQLYQGLDQLVQPWAKSMTTTTPPGSPASGDLYILQPGSSPTGAWSGQAGKIVFWNALYQTSATNTYAPQWVFLTPQNGWHFWVADASRLATYGGAAWSYGAADVMTTLGDTIYEDATPKAARLAGNTTATKKYLSQTGNGTISAAPSWAQVAAADLSNGTTGSGAVVLAVSPALTGAPAIAAATATTPSAGDNSTNVATTAFTNTIFAAPPALGSTTPSSGAFTTSTATGDYHSTSTITTTNNTGTLWNFDGDMTTAPSATSSSQTSAFRLTNQVQSSNSQNLTATGAGGINGASSILTFAGTGTLTRGVGFNATMNTGSGANPITDYMGYRAIVNNSGTGTIGSAYGYRAETFTNTGGGAITNLYGIKVENQTAGGTNYAFFSGSGLVKMGDTTDATSPTSASALTVSGGVSAAKSIYWGGNGVMQGANGGQYIIGQSSELLTLSTSGTTTDTVGNLLPANAVIDSVVVRVTTTITTATNWEIGDATTAARFVSPVSTLTAGTTAVGLNHVDQTGAAGPKQVSAAKVRVTTTGTPGAGAIRITVFYRQYVAPTS